MHLHRSIALVATVAALACGKGEQASEPAKEHVVFGEFIAPEDSFPKIRYYEAGLVSPNDRCAVRKVRLNVKMPPVYVNGRPIGFC
ncbi:MAG TPA: hypothetical protein VEC56_08150 [Candidatus Krumholzibacteria bacterium]|nr:hypothetical protein [Candidatus Krumholzibacteria bacterium]